MFKHSIAYDILRFFVRISFSLFYRKIEIKGLENIPKNKPIIFAPNHQNALMDPLAIVFTNPLQTIFLTRADIFKRPLLLKIFTFLKMLPVYRVRDGVESLSNNEVIFRKSVEILVNKKAIALFPEASHNNKMFLLPLKKAVPRIAFQAESENNFELDVQIVPVGIYYDSYENSNSYHAIHYGKPISVCDYKEQYLENPQKCLNVLKDDLSIEIKKLVVDFPDEKDYPSFISLSSLLWESGNLKKKYTKFEAIRLIAKNLIQLKDTDLSGYNLLIEQVKEFDLLRNSINPKSIIKANLRALIFKCIVFIILFPVFVYGVVNHILYYWLMNKKVLKNVKDRQFHSSIKFGFAAIAAPIVYLVHFLVFYLISFNLEYSLLYLLSLPLSAIITNKLTYYWQSLSEDYSFLFKSKNSSKIKEDAKILYSKTAELLQF